jgi:hypothetical protein
MIYLCAIKTFNGLGWDAIQDPFISSMAAAASEVLENLM